MYPVASTNEQDLHEPRGRLPGRGAAPRHLPQRARSSSRRAGTSRLPTPRQGAGGDQAAQPTLVNGVVYNEMKGALSDPDSRALRRAAGGAVPRHRLRASSPAARRAAIPDAHLRALPRGTRAPLPPGQQLHHPVRQPGPRPHAGVLGRALPDARGRRTGETPRAARSRGA